jgi:hypothetical protein
MWNGRGLAAVAVLVARWQAPAAGKGEAARDAARKRWPRASRAASGRSKRSPKQRRAEQRRTCDQTCGCIVDEMFLPSGAPRADAKPMAEIAVACAGRFAGAAAPAASAAPASPLPFPELMPLPAVRDEKDLPAAVEGGDSAGR